jgi:hypothetical protein
MNTQVILGSEKNRQIHIGTSELVSPKIAESLRSMPSGTHAILVYDTQESKRDVLLSHLGLGVNRAGLVYAYAEEGPDRIREEMKKFGIDAGHLEKKNTLAIRSSEDVYIANGKVDTEGIIKGFSDLAWDYTRKGMDGIRASAEMSPFFRRGMISELEKYEHALHRRFSFPGRGVCAYNLIELQNSGHLETLMPMLRAHAVVILTGPKGGVVLEPDTVTEKDVEKVMAVPILR